MAASECVELHGRRDDDDEVIFLKDKCIRYFKRCLQVLPERFSSLDVTRLTVAFFAISGLDLLDAIDAIKDEKEKIIEWIYSYQVLPDKIESNRSRCGFRGSSAVGAPPSMGKPENAHPYDSGHIAMTYSALSTLLVLGDDLSRVDKKAIIQGVEALQQPDGSFCPLIDGAEKDMRFIYCAACICYILQDWGEIDKEKIVKFIQKCINYDGGIAQVPGAESHGGSIFCAVAALSLIDQLQTAFSPSQINKLRWWCLKRQDSGFQGRPNKPVDTCYSFWVGASLTLLDYYHFVDTQQNIAFILSTQDDIAGGLAKWPDVVPDPLHTYLGIGGLSLAGKEGVLPIHPGLNISKRAVDHLKHIHNQWGVASNIYS
ncbi:geranylgeranyl transferase type-1 subunit beta-like [Limulus polyphemus]|uniref:Geranylgeranyl transferase type-1 subunit beta n=1 Tax=Limulus polyphemus TaxID=6850 RepID=A0ABM1S487_LIMPO|nr:geranylgeranyl transferase type-1 subunit beta-like [Limulus polyphemus]